MSLRRPKPPIRGGSAPEEEEEETFCSLKRGLLFQLYKIDVYENL